MNHFLFILHMQEKSFAELNIEALCSINMKSLIFKQRQITRNQFRSHLFFKAEMFKFFQEKIFMFLSSRPIEQGVLYGYCDGNFHSGFDSFLSMCRCLLMSTGHPAVRLTQLACQEDRTVYITATRIGA